MSTDTEALERQVETLTTERDAAYASLREAGEAARRQRARTQEVAADRALMAQALFACRNVDLPDDVAQLVQEALEGPSDE